MKLVYEPIHLKAQRHCLDTYRLIFIRLCVFVDGSYNNNNFVTQLCYVLSVIVEFIFEIDYYRQ